MGKILKQKPTDAAFPEGLHGAIMGKVRATARTGMRRESRPGFFYRWAFGVAMMVIGAVWFGPVKHPAVDAEKAPSLALATATLDMGSDWVREAPAAAVAPLTEEAEYLRNDLDRAGQFLYASLP